MRAIAASRIPTVSAVGHEIDVTLADLAADVRALTPSEAAERVVPSAEEITHANAQLSASGCGRSSRRLLVLRTGFAALVGQRSFRRPFDLIHDRSRRLDEMSLRATAMRHGRCAGPARAVGDAGGQARIAQPIGRAGTGL